ncbi:hypothetical protein MIMGU_mgv11b0139211mg, partial [Erythranthe guttata]
YLYTCSVPTPYNIIHQNSDPRSLLLNKSPLRSPLSSSGIDRDFPLRPPPPTPHYCLC